MVGETEESELSEVSEELWELDGEELWELEMLEELLGRLEEVPDEELEDLSLLKQAVMLIIIAMASRTAVVRVSFIRLTPIKNNYTGQSLRRAHTEKRKEYFFILYFTTFLRGNKDAKSCLLSQRYYAQLRVSYVGRKNFFAGDLEKFLNFAGTCPVRFFPYKRTAADRQFFRGVCTLWRAVGCATMKLKKRRAGRKAPDGLCLKKEEQHETSGLYSQ